MPSSCRVRPSACGAGKLRSATPAAPGLEGLRSPFNPRLHCGCDKATAQARRLSWVPAAGAVQQDRQRPGRWMASNSVPLLPVPDPSLYFKPVRPMPRVCQVEAILDSCNLLVIVGTSAVVYPAAG